MKLVDADQEMTALLPHCEDVEHFVGFTLVPNALGRQSRLAFVRIIFKKDAELRDLPEQLVYRRAVEAGTGLEMFFLSAPGEYLTTPLLVTEWTPDCSNFAEGVDISGLFLLEMLTPSKARRALISNGRVTSQNEFAITAEEYASLCNAFSAPPRSEPKEPS
jgi:hypothetical protein